VAASGKIKGALAVSQSRADPDLPTHEPELRKDRPVILYCDSGGRAALAGKTPLDMGFADVRNAGGFKALADAGLPTGPA
jgi:rhodanese-related sulfurtransferase